MIGQAGNLGVESVTGVERMPRHLISILLSLVGAILGGVVGFYTVGWLSGQGFYGMIIPGALLGLGCSLFSPHTSMARGVFCAIAALSLSLFTEWWWYPFNADGSFSYFLNHVKDLPPVKFLMIGIGIAIAFWMGKDAGFRWLAERRTSAPTRSDHTSKSEP
jgi:hypothetical protein